MMHENETYNIVQTGSGFTRSCWSVFKGKRLPSGAPARGAVEIASGLNYEEAKKLADKMEAAH